MSYAADSRVTSENADASSNDLAGRDAHGFPGVAIVATLHREEAVGWR
jgi:hypothetical protein